LSRSGGGAAPCCRFERLFERSDDVRHRHQPLQEGLAFA